jgi:hypothetical protein
MQLQGVVSTAQIAMRVTRARLQHKNLIKVVTVVWLPKEKS